MWGDSVRGYVKEHPQWRYPIDNYAGLAEAVRWPNQAHELRRNHRLKGQPDAAMLASRQFYADHAEGVARVTGWLADDESKSTYQRIIAFRQYRDSAVAPYHGIRHQYLPPDLIRLTTNDVCVDGGAFIGDTALKFIRRAAPEGRSLSRRARAAAVPVVCFEPDPANFEILARVARDYPTITPIQAATYREDTDLTFETGLSFASHVAAGAAAPGAMTVAAKAIDHVPECAEATYIKMDVEGSELDTLLGAQQVIERNRPKLAVCIYHSDEDMLRLAEWLHERYPFYRLYVRHHSRFTEIETVLYALPEH
jgi:FkbM family methyltransferase